jgi:hypothetical protein
MERSKAVKWCNSRLSKGNHYDMDDIEFTRNFTNKLHGKLLDVEEVVNSFQRRHAMNQLKGFMQTMFTKVLDEFKINEVRNTNNKIIKFF